MALFNPIIAAIVCDFDDDIGREPSLERTGGGGPGRGRRSSTMVDSRTGGRFDKPGIGRCEATLVLGNFQGIVLLDMGMIKVGDGTTATLRVEAPEDARKPITTIGVDSKHPPPAGLSIDMDHDVSLSRGEHYEAEISWHPENPGKFRGNVSFRVDGRFPAQVSVVGEALGKDQGKGKRGGRRDSRMRDRSSVGGSADGGIRSGHGPARGRTRSLSQERSGVHAEPHTSMFGKENRLSLSTMGLPGADSTMMGSTSLLRSSADSALTQTTTNKRQQMLKYSASRRLSLRPPTNKNHKSGKGAGVGDGGDSKNALMRKSLNDKGWAEKQAAGFTNWLNFTLGGAEKPHSGGDTGDGADVCDDMEKSAGFGRGVAGGGAGGGGGSPLKAMVAMRQAARQRMRAMSLFRSVELRALSDAVTLRAAEGTISLRRDRVLHADVGLSAALIDLVLCYQPRWLLLGLETVFGEIVPVPTSGAGKGNKLDRALRTFVAERLVKCPDIKAKFGFRGRTASGRSEMEYNEVLSRHALRNFLDLVLFLDRAKMENLLHPCPCLFRKTAEVKSSVGMLKVFCQFLHGEGDFVRHLKKIGYIVTHVQSYIDEFDFHVCNLAVDLRDGVRLTRLVEVVTGEWGLATGLRVPAGSRLQKVFNTGLALAKLERDGVTSASAAAKVTAKDVVDGDRDATLRLLWAIIARYSLSALISHDALASEAEAVVSAARKWRHAGSSPARAERFRRRHRDDGATVVLEEGEGGTLEALSPPSAGRAVAGPEHPPLALPDVEATCAKWGTPENAEGEVGGNKGGEDEQLLSALLAWCQAVCHGYGVPVRNFTTSFADGRALCLLLHYYHPRILPLNAIHRTTAHLPKVGSGGEELEDWSSGLDVAQVTDAQCKAALDGERANVNLARRCVEELGGVPSMLAPFDSTNRPEEKTIITVVAHLCARLLESSAEIRATIHVQRSYRAYLERTGRGDLVQRARAAKAEARARAIAERIAREKAAAAAVGLGGTGLVDPCTPPPRGHARRSSASVLASPELNVYVSERQEAHLAAIVVQQWWRRASSERLRRMGANTAATVVQAAWRGCSARSAYADVLVARAEERRVFEAASRIQAIARGKCRRDSFLLHKEATIAVQAWLRSRLQRRWYLAFKSQLAKIVLIQALIRGGAGRRKAATRRRELQERAAAANFAAIVIQSIARRNATRAAYKEQRTAATRLQAWYRGDSTRARLSTEAQERAEEAERLEWLWNDAACILQALIRGAAVRLAYRHERAAVVAIQARVRGIAARARAEQRRKAVVALQAWIRATIASLDYGRSLSAICVLQAWTRGVVTRERLAIAAIAEAIQRREEAAVVCLQAWARGMSEARQYRRKVEVVVTLQARYRGAVAREWVVQQRRDAAQLAAAAVAVQAWWRRSTVRIKIAADHNAAVVIQAFTRAAIARERYGEAIAAAVVIQTRWRGAAAAIWYARQRDAAIVVQSMFRARRVRRTYANQVEQAIRLQAWWRSKVAQALARELSRQAAGALAQKRECSAVRLQAAWRAKVVRTHCRRAFRSVVALQAFVRGSMTRTRLHREWIERQRVEQERVEQERRLAAEREFRKAQAAALVLQTWQRGRFARAALAAAKVLKQEQLRKAAAAAAVVMQSAARGLAARRALKAKSAAALAVQTAVRAKQARVELSRKRAERDRALRDLACRQAVAATKIQSMARAASARVLTKKMKEEVRMRRSEQEYNAAVIVQATWRGTRARVRASAMRAQRAAAIRAAEEAAAALLRASEAATVIQSSIRRYRAETSFNRSRAAIIAIQTHRRRITAIRLVAIVQAERAAAVRAAALEAAREAAAVRLQAIARGAAARECYRRCQSAVLVIQALGRTVSTRARLQVAEEAESRRRQAEREELAAVKMVAWWRMMAAKARFSVARNGIVELQALWRARATRCRLAHEDVASSALGAWWRAVREAKRLRVARRGVVALQSVVRGRCGRRDVAALWQEVGRRFCKETATTMIQAAVRGRRVRRVAGPGLANLRARLIEAEERRRADPSLTLGAMVDSALRSLEHGTQLTSIIRACITLELSTRYSKVCCQVVAESRAPRVLYDLVRGLNRSPPHQKILKYTITTFRNVSQRGGKLPALMAAPPVAAETFLDLLQMYRERQEVFLPTVRLLQQLVSAHQPTKDICNEPKNAQRLESISDILGRKAATESKGAGVRGVGSPSKGRVHGGGGFGGGVSAVKSARSLKALQLLIQELKRK